MRTLDDWAVQLGRSPIFGALSPAGRVALAGAGSPVHLIRGERLFSAGDAGDAAYLLLSGELEVGLSRADGGETWLASLTAGAIIGDMAVLDGGQRSADVTATRTSTLLRLHNDAVLTALTAEPETALRLVRVLVGRLRSVNSLVEAATKLDVGARLARLLLETEHRETRSQTDLARIAGTTRESVNRKLSEWREAGWIDVSRRGIAVSDPAALQRQAQFDAPRTPRAPRRAGGMDVARA
jgi:CRP-like cAMP-binding protein